MSFFKGQENDAKHEIKILVFNYFIEEKVDCSLLNINYIR